MKVSISKSSEYPIYGLAPSPVGFDVPADLYQRYAASLKEFDEVQAEIARIYEAPDSAREQQ